MAKYTVVWNINIAKDFEAESEEKAVEMAENIDCQHEGEYQVDTYEIVKVIQNQ